MSLQTRTMRLSSFCRGTKYFQQRLLRAAAVVALGMVVGSSLFALPARAAFIHESGTFSTSIPVSGVSIIDSQFLGSRFTVDSTVNVDSIGGHIYRHDNVGIGNNGLLFGAIIELASSSALPTGSAATKFDPESQVLAHTTFDPGTANNIDFTTPLSATLTPGVVYGLVFGTGLYGASGTGVMTQNNGALAGFGIDTFFQFNSGMAIWKAAAWDGTMRFTVGGNVSAVPLPAALPLFAGGLGLLGLLGWRRKRMAAA